MAAANYVPASGFPKKPKKNNLDDLLFNYITFNSLSNLFYDRTSKINKLTLEQNCDNKLKKLNMTSRWNLSDTGLYINFFNSDNSDAGHISFHTEHGSDPTHFKINGKSIPLKIKIENDKVIITSPTEKENLPEGIEPKDVQQMTSPVGAALKSVLNHVKRVGGTTGAEDLIYIEINNIPYSNFLANVMAAIFVVKIDIVANFAIANKTNIAYSEKYSMSFDKLVAEHKMLNMSAILDAFTNLDPNMQPYAQILEKSIQTQEFILDDTYIVFNLAITNVTADKQTADKQTADKQTADKQTAEERDIFNKYMKYKNKYLELKRLKHISNQATSLF